MEFSVMNPAQAAHFSSFILPHVRDLPDRDSFWYLCAWEEAFGLAGLAVVDPKLEGGELLSLAVSPPKQGQGIGSALIRYAAEQLSAAEIHQLEVLYSLPLEAWPRLETLLRRTGFQRESEVDTFTLPLSKLVEFPLVKAFMSRPRRNGVFSLGQVPHYAFQALSRHVMENGLFGPLQQEDYHPDLSACYLEGDEITACFLIRDLGSGQVENSWTYLRSPNHGAALMELFAFSAQQAEALGYPPQTQVGFACLNEASENLLRHLGCGDEPQSISRRYVRPTDLSYHRSGDWTPPDMKLTLADDQDLRCVRCVHRIEDLTSCRKYLSKPGAVLYGGACKHFQEK